MAARSVSCTLVNSTGEALSLVDKTIDHGIFPAGQEPPAACGDEGAVWYSESDGFLTGTEGTATYRGATGTVKVHWDNPFFGGNSFDAAPAGDYVMVRVDGPAVGSNVGVVYRVEKKTKPAPPPPAEEPPAAAPAVDPPAPAAPVPDPGPEDHRNDAHVPIVDGKPSTLSVKRWLVDVAWEVVNNMEWDQQVLEITENRHGEQSGAICPGTLPKWDGVELSGTCHIDHEQKREKRKTDKAAKVAKAKAAGKSDADAELEANNSLLFNDFHSWCGDYVSWVFWKSWCLRNKPEDKITRATLKKFLNREALAPTMPTGLDSKALAKWKSDNYWQSGENLNMVEKFAKDPSNGLLVWHPFGDSYVPTPGDIWMANRDNGGHIGIVGWYDTNPSYDELDKAKAKPFHAFVTLDGKSFEDPYMAGKKEPEHDAAGWNKDLGWNTEAGENNVKLGGSDVFRPQGIAQTHRSTRQKGKGSFASSPIIRSFIDTSKLREALGYR